MNKLSFEQPCIEEYRLRLPAENFEKFTFMLGYHGSEDDFPLTLRPEFEHADIVFHERIGWTAMDLAGLNMVASGQLESPSYQSPLNMRITELIKHTKAVQAMWDVPVAHLSAPKFLSYFSTYHAPTTESAFDQYYSMTISRDKLALRTIGPQIDKAIAERKVPAHPRILLLAGMSHLLLANVYKFESAEEVAITTPYGDDIAVNAATDYVRLRLQGINIFDMNALATRAIKEEALTLAGHSPTHLIAAKANSDYVDT